MKKKLSILALLLALALVLTACSNDTTPDTSSDDANDKPQAVDPVDSGDQLIMATEAGFAPYEYYEGNEIVGIDIDIANAIADAMGKELVVVDMEFGAILNAVSTGKADFGGAGLSIDAERLLEVDFSIEYATSKQIFIVPADSTVTNIDDLIGETVGVQLGTVADLELSDVEGITVQQYNKYLEAVNDLLNGRIAAIGMDILPAEELVKANDGLKIVEEEFLIDTYAFAVQKGNTEMLEQINAVLQQLIDDGKIDEFTLKHTGE